ncbi:MAG: hypothetical protein IGS49_04580 [Chlorogloeopsis fritschii C42_A2020_084]|uniref:Clp protease N-terminal domain-containing protein n=1 Tax=Chlorogloeopsis fritschii TaxID=1124 RepID=UPI0019F2A62D|nr:Clp protease N-terminal domain-containing protein [Chlorogloeopsis fritschii]MBF2004746.1 hypothetical protein [Chlorogloeopsis fritschii C42_A2020_084]
MFERFLPESIEVILLAKDELVSVNKKLISTEYILLGLITQGSRKVQTQWNGNDTTVVPGIAAKILQAAGLTPEIVRSLALSSLVQSRETEEIDAIEFNKESASSSAPMSKQMSPNLKNVIVTYFHECRFNERVLQSFLIASQRANEFEQKDINTGHLLLGLIEEGEEIVNGTMSNAVKIIETLDTSCAEIKQQVIDMLGR